MVSGVLSDFRHLNLSNPIESAWLSKLKLEAQTRKIILIGDGITAHEYRSILERAGVHTVAISVKKFLSKVDWKSDLNCSTRPFLLIASPAKLPELSEHAATLGFIPETDFFSHFHALRNRMVVDLRSGSSDNSDDLNLALDTALSIPTLGGIDFLATNTPILEEVFAVAAEKITALHSKAVIFLQPDQRVQTSGLKGFNSVEINATHFIEEQEYYESFFSTFLANLEVSENTYFLVTEYLFKKYSCLSSARMYIDLQHAWYLDEILTGLERGINEHPHTIKGGSSNKCLSRRMFPALDENFKLKKCSLYDTLGRTHYLISDLENEGFVQERSELCLRCAKFKLHRLL